MSKGTLDLTTGGILDRLLKVALPVMGVQLLNMAYNLTDMFWLGRLSSDAVAASGTAGMYMWMSMAFLMFGRMAAEIGVSQNLGRGDAKTAARYSGIAMTINAVLGVAFAAVMMIFANPLIGFFAIKEAHVALDAVQYLRWVAPSIFFQFLGGVMGGTFSAAGNTRIPLYVNIVGLVLNVILDPICIFTLKMGVAGAALATTLSIAVTCLVGIWVLARSRFKLFEHYRLFVKPKAQELKQILGWAAPVAIESFCFTFLSMLVSRVVTGFGSEAIAVQKLGSQVESMSWLIAGGFASALTAFVGQNYGAGKWSRIRKSVSLAYQMMAVWGAFVTVLLLFFGGFFFSLFVSEPEVIAGGILMLRYTALGTAATCLENVAMGAFRGVGNTRPSMTVSITTNVLRVPLAWWLSTTALGVNGVWLGLAIGALCRGTWLMLWQTAASRRDPKIDTVTQDVLA